MRFFGRVVLVGALLLAACSKDSTPKADSDSSTSAGKASLTLAGDPGLDGAVGTPEVTCQFPDVEGLRIAVLAQASDPNIVYRVSIGPDKVTLRVDSGAGSDFHERTFEGSGVSQFEPRTGAHVDAQLTEVASAADSDHGSLGVVRAIKGTVECGDQTPGSSTITVTGDTATAHFDKATLEPALVECYFSAGEVIVLGIAHAGDTKVHLLVSITSQGLGIEEELQPSGQRRYEAAPGSSSAASVITGDGGRANGDVVEKDATPPHALHVEGEAVCGTPVRG